MGILAEPRRKKRYSRDPNNTTWSRDNEKLGQKLLQKMGWKEGKGLGANQQGETEHIKVSMKLNNSGVGAQKRHDLNWLENVDAFSGVLASLNAAHSADAGETSNAKTSDKEQGDEGAVDVTLRKEEKQRNRRRLHYRRLHAGKDYTSFTSVHVSQILGGERDKGKDRMIEDDVETPRIMEVNSESQTGEKRPRSNDTIESSSSSSGVSSEAQEQQLKQTEETSVADTAAQKRYTGHQISNLSVQEYLAQRMAERRARLAAGGPGNAPEQHEHTPADDVPEIHPQNAEPDYDDDETGQDDKLTGKAHAKQRSKSKKEKKSKKSKKDKKSKKAKKSGKKSKKDKKSKKARNDRNK
eukprot:Clim_evm14s119 gene=Clim_evmTU14s119